MTTYVHQRPKELPKWVGTLCLLFVLLIIGGAVHHTLSPKAAAEQLTPSSLCNEMGGNARESYGCP